MKIDIAKVASLSRLKIAEGKQEELVKQLESILEYFAQIQSINTDGVEPMVTPHDTASVFREDQALRDDDFISQALAQAPDVKGKLIKVPPVVGGES